VYKEEGKMETVKEILEWKNNKKEKSLEEMFLDEKEKLEWDVTDTLYSFLGIYVIGLRSYYPPKFRCTTFQIRTENHGILKHWDLQKIPIIL